MQNFSQAQLAFVAYAEVSGADGTSTLTNSGITTTKIADGIYGLILPSASQNQVGLQQASDRDLIFVQPKNAAFPVASSAVNDADATIKLVYLGVPGGTYVACDFSVIILRTLTPPTLGGPA